MVTTCILVGGFLIFLYGKWWQRKQTEGKNPVEESKKVVMDIVEKGKTKKATLYAIKKDSPQDPKGE